MFIIPPWKVLIIYYFFFILIFFFNVEELSIRLDRIQS